MPVSKIPGTHIQEWWPFQISLFAENKVTKLKFSEAYAKNKINAIKL